MCVFVRKSENARAYGDVMHATDASRIGRPDQLAIGRIDLTDELYALLVSEVELRNQHKLLRSLRRWCG